MSRTVRLSLLALLVPVSLAACSSDEPEVDDRAATVVLAEAADTTLMTRRFTVDLEARLDIDGRDLGLTADGRVDYDAVVADLTLGAEQSGSSSVAQILADGERVWVSLEGDEAPGFPGGARYVQGDSDELSAATTFAPESLLGVLHALRGAEDVEQGDDQELDGVDVRVFSFTVAYRDAVDAAGEDVESFEAAFNLTGEATAADLDIEVAIGPDDVVRHFALEIVPGDLPIAGTYDLSLSSVDEDVAAPDAPADGEVASVEDSSAVLEQLLT